MEKSIAKMEKIYNNKKDKKRLIILIIKYYLAFLDTEKLEYIKKAYFLAKEYISLNNTDFDMLFLICFFSLEQKKQEEAKKFLNTIGKYKKYLKNNEPKKYAFYIYLKGIEKINNEKSPTKYIKILEGDTKDRDARLFVIDLRFRVNILERNSISNITTEFQKSFFSNLILYKVLEKSSKFFHLKTEVFEDYVKWAYKNSVNIERAMDKYNIHFNFNIEKENYSKKLYEKYKLDIILKNFCEEYIANGKTTRVSFFFYEEAIKRQIQLEGLIPAYIKGCYKFNIEEIKIYPIKKFLEDKNIDLDIIAFIYHIILTNKKYSQLIADNHEKILEYANFFLEKKCIGRHYYSIYKHLLGSLKGNRELEKKIIQIIYPIYYSYEITILDEKAKWILIKDRELNEIRKYEINNKKANIRAVSSDFSYYIFDDEDKEVLLSKATIEKVIQDNSTKIAIKFFENNMINKFTLINLGKYFLSTENVSFEAIKILLKILEIEGLSNNFKMKILQLMGNIYFKNEDYPKATSCFKKVSERELSDKYIDNVLLSYVECFENEKAIEIIKKKAHIISESVLYIALRSISENEEYDKDIAIFAYEMLMKGKIDNLFIEIVLKNYNGGLLEWIELRKVLEQRGVLRQNVDEYILRKTIYTHNLNKESERIFAKVFHSNIENIIIEDFLNYCIYESIFNEYEFSEETVKIMELIFMEYEYEELGYCLSHLYFRQNFDLEKKDNILKKIIFNMEKSKINFEIFEENKSKLTKYDYIFKNRGFIYKTLPEKEVYFFYRQINQNEYTSVKMKYFKFGIYICTLPVFFGEEIEYYFSENGDGKNICSEKYIATNRYNQIFDKIDQDYFKINNSVIHSHEGKYHLTHNLIKNMQEYNLKGKLL